MLVRSVEQLSGRGRLLALYKNYDREQDFFSAATRLLKLDLKYERAKLNRIPSSGPLVIVANHPFGIVDGVALAHLIGQRRDDLRIVAHGLLTRAPEAAERILPIDFAETRQATKTNLATRKAAIGWLEQGGAVLIFPSGMVSTATSFLGPVVDERWKPFTARLIHETRSTVLPIHTAGRNSMMFQWASLLHPALRAATLLNEVRNKIGQQIDIAIGDTIDYNQLSDIRDRQLLVDRLYDHVYALADPDEPDGPVFELAQEPDPLPVI